MGAEDYLPPDGDLEELRRAAGACRGCSLHENATRTVFGDGDPHGEVMLVGEQPGDQEDRRGEPFVGPAGQLLDRALEEAGIDRSRTYVTNAVKHFKWEQRGKRRLHKKPSASEVAACRPWLEAEIRVVRPRLVVCLGATAARSLLGPGFRVTQRRGELLDGPDGTLVTATVHPSSILRAPDEAARRQAMGTFVGDLRRAAAAVGGPVGRRGPAGS